MLSPEEFDSVIRGFVIFAITTVLIGGFVLGFLLRCVIG